uniref:Uncharacterized protein n=1 Tax=Panagrellus redivivus TaxID=6233 RepID=A0A7E4VZX1_PANRE
MTPGLIIISLFWILFSTLPLVIAVISLCMKKKHATDGKNAGQGLKKPTSSSMADNKTNTGPDKKQNRQMSTDKGTSASQPEKALSPMRPNAFSPTPTVGPNKTTDDVADELSKNPKGLSDEARNPPSAPQKTGAKTFGVTQGGPTPVVPATDDKKDTVQSPKPSPGNAPGEKVEPTQKSFQSSKKKRMASKERSKERSKDRSKERTQKPKQKSEKAPPPPQFAPEMDVDDDEETLQNVKSLEKDLEPSLQNDAK